MVIVFVSYVLVAIVVYCLIALTAILVKVTRHGGINTFTEDDADILAILAVIHMSILMQTMATLESLVNPKIALPIIIVASIANVLFTVETIIRTCSLDIFCAEPKRAKKQRGDGVKCYWDQR